MILQLPFAIKDLPVYPTGRPFTEFEALIDLLICGHSTTLQIIELAAKWQWDVNKTSDFVANNSHWFKEDIYVKESNQRAVAQSVIDVYNEIFDRKCILNDYRIRTINARIKEGRKMTPPIGLLQFKAVFEFQKSKWMGTEQEDYLTIETLCAAKHFLKYLEAARLDFKKKLHTKKTEEEGVTLSGSLFKTQAS